MNASTSAVSYNHTAEQMPKAMVAIDHVRDAALSINSLEKTIDQLSERLGDALIAEVTSIGSVNVPSPGMASAEPSTGTTLCDNIYNNDRQIRALNARLGDLIERLRV